MYLPSLFAESRPKNCGASCREHPLNMLVTNTAEVLDASHLPFVLDEARGPFEILLAHVARANTMWKRVLDSDPVLVVFRGAHGYISPNWYLSKHETYRHVPT